MVNEISADSIQSYIEKMVSFGTRHSLSDTTSNEIGIGAARRWVASKFTDFGKRNKANIKVELDPYVLKPGPRSSRIPYPVTMKNVLGTLPGTDMGSRNGLHRGTGVPHLDVPPPLAPRAGGEGRRGRRNPDG